MSCRIGRRRVVLRFGVTSYVVRRRRSDHYCLELVVISQWITTSPTTISTPETTERHEKGVTTIKTFTDVRKKIEITENDQHENTP